MSKAIKITGMSCNHCAMAVTKALGALDGVENVKVDLNAGEASYDESRPVELTVLKAAIEKAGYQVAQ